jgi:ABC-type enterochelin transport system permease subunit
MKDKLLNWINLALVADFFLVLFAFFWLAIAVAGHALHLPLGLNLWYKLWQPVFTPAIGILIAGTIVSGVTSWVAKRFNSQQTNKL